MKQIPLTNGLAALVDDADFEMLSAYTWTHFKSRAVFYAAAWVNHRPLLMHVKLLGKQAGKMIDHRNRNTLDNQRHNLRFSTQRQNSFNTPPRVTNKTGFKGVQIGRHGGFIASIKDGHRCVYLGRFDDPIEAAKAYNAAALKLEPDFAYLNPV